MIAEIQGVPKNAHFLGHPVEVLESLKQIDGYGRMAAEGQERQKAKVQNARNYCICERLYICIFQKTGIVTISKQSECNVNSYNKDTVAFCKCECPDLMKQLIFQGYGIFICTKC